MEGLNSETDTWTGKKKQDEAIFCRNQLSESVD